MKEYLIPLENSDKYFIVDEIGYKKCKNKSWRLKDNYVVEGGGHNKTINYLHRELLGLEINDGLLADHINRNPLDNRLMNLRVATNSQNMCNRGKLNIKNPSSKYKGVRYLKRNCYWQVRIQVNKKSLTIGHYYSEEASANMYNYYARSLHGEFAVLNDVPHMSVEECENYKVKRGRKHEECISK